MTADEVDVRDVPKPQRHPMIFQRFSKLAVGEAFVLINGHDPRHLHDEFERDYPRRYSWEPVKPGDPDHMPNGQRLLHVVADRIQWQTALDLARRRAAESDLSATGRAA